MRRKVRVSLGDQRQAATTRLWNILGIQQLPPRPKPWSKSIITYDGALAAANEIMAIDLVTLPVGFEMPLYSADKRRGKAQQSAFEWIPSVGIVPDGSVNYARWKKPIYRTQATTTLMVS